MDGVSGINSVYSPAITSPSMPATIRRPQPGRHGRRGHASPSLAIHSQEWASLSSLAINQSSESLLVADNASSAAVSNELLGPSCSS
jgi:hypothetical protein